MWPIVITGQKAIREIQRSERAVTQALEVSSSGAYKK
jgi:hypothetical protein